MAQFMRRVNLLIQLYANVLTITQDLYLDKLDLHFREHFYEYIVFRFQNDYSE
jgi:hypothetical protein